MQPTPGAVKALLKNAENYLEAAKVLSKNQTLQVFTLAYEGYFQLVQAVMEHFEVRSKDSGKNLAIQRVAATLQANSGEFALLVKAHERRNGTSYNSPFPPVSQAEAQTLVQIVEKLIPKAYELAGLSSTNAP